MVAFITGVLAVKIINTIGASGSGGGANINGIGDAEKCNSLKRDVAIS